MNQDRTQRVDLGAGGRRWWPIAVGVLAAWVVLAVIVGGGSGGDPASAPADDPTTTATTAARTPSTRRGTLTTTTTTIPGAPLLGRRTGWHLYVSGGRSVLIDLDTGGVAPVAHGGVVASRPDGVFTVDGQQIAWWRPFPFDDATAVELGLGDGAVWPVPGDDLAWVTTQALDAGTARLVSLATGALQTEVDLPTDGWAIGAVAGGELVVTAGGDAFLIGRSGQVRRLGTGQPIGVAGDAVLLRVCSESLRCEVVAHDVRTGESAAVAGAPDGPWFIEGPGRPDGTLLASVPSTPERRESTAILIDRDGARPALPAGMAAHNLWASAWTPDGSLLFTWVGGAIVAIDPFADGGPREVARLHPRGVEVGPLAVVQPRSED